MLLIISFFVRDKAIASSCDKSFPGTSLGFTGQLILINSYLFCSAVIYLHILLTANISFIIEYGCNIGPAAVRRVTSAYFNDITVLVAEIVRAVFPAYIEAGIKMPYRA